MTAPMSAPNNQPTRTQSSAARARSRLISVLLCLAALLLLIFSSPGYTQTEDYPHHAGLVVQFGDGRVETACIDLGSDGAASGEEVLLSSELDVQASYNSKDQAAICKIEEDGCTYPGSTCFCQCQNSSDASCTYWAYFHLVKNDWQYGGLGVSTYTVRAGAVEGWSWGKGQLGKSGTPPPIKTFEEICQAAENSTTTRTTARTATRTPAADEPAQTTRTPTASRGQSSPTPIDPDAPPDEPPPTRTAQPANDLTEVDESATPTLSPSARSLPCPAASTTLIEGTAPPDTALVLFFAGRAVGGGTSDTAGFYRLPLIVGNERPGNYLVEVFVRDSHTLLQELICQVPAVTPEP